MKAPVLLLVLASAFAGVAPAQASLTTGEPLPVVAFSVDDTAVATGPAGALLESNYFNAPQNAFGRGNSCRLPPSLVAKTRLAQSCH